MRIGIDVSQLAYENTGVANYLENLVRALVSQDLKNEYVLFFSSLRRRLPADFEEELGNHSNVLIRKFKLPPSALNLLWNVLHLTNIEQYIGDVDLFVTSDWAEPPVRHAKKATILYDLIVYRHPEETDQKIVSVQKRKLKWVKKESDIVFCISESTKKDAEEILGLDLDKLKVIYPGL